MKIKVIITLIVGFFLMSCDGQVSSGQKEQSLIELKYPKVTSEIKRIVESAEMYYIANGRLPLNIVEMQEAAYFQYEHKLLEDGWVYITDWEFDFIDDKISGTIEAMNWKTGEEITYIIELSTFR